MRQSAYLELVRPPNVATALADVLAGFAVAGMANARALPWLLLATACLYAGGVALNDVFDRDIDRRERPERPIPSGRVPVSSAAILGATLMATGTAAAFAGGRTAGLVALVIVALVLLYDAWGKHRPVIGPINMGLCRGANLLLGAAAVPAIAGAAWPVAAIAVTYIAAVTLVSRGEVSGGAAVTARVALGLLLCALGGLTVLSIAARASVAGSLLLTAILAWRVVPAFHRVVDRPDPGTIRRAVRTGVLSLALLDGVIATAFAGMIYGLALLVTAFLAVRLARAFAVT